MSSDYVFGTLRAAAALAALGGVALAQSGASSSENYLSTARSTPAAAGHSASESFVLHAEVGVPHASGAESPDFRFRGGVIGAPATIEGALPVVFGIAGGLGPKEGGASERLFGFGFEAPGVSVDSVLVGGSPATVSEVSGNTSVAIVTPSGLADYGNPKGPVEVELISGPRTVAGESPYVYLPALEEAGPPRLGRTYRVRYYAEERSLHQLALGASIPGQSLPVPGIDGAWELVDFYIFVSSFDLESSERGFQSFDFTVGTMPSFIGIQVEFQSFAISLDAPLQGAFTNRLVTYVQE